MTHAIPSNTVLRIPDSHAANANGSSPSRPAMGPAVEAEAESKSRCYEYTAMLLALGNAIIAGVWIADENKGYLRKIEALSNASPLNQTAIDSINKTSTASNIKLITDLFQAIATNSISIFTFMVNATYRAKDVGKAIRAWNALVAVGAFAAGAAYVDSGDVATGTILLALSTLHFQSASWSPVVVRNAVHTRVQKAWDWTKSWFQAR